MIADKMKQSILNEVYLGLSSFISENISNWKSNKLNRIADIYTGNSIPETVKKNKYMHIKEGYNYIGTKDLGFNHEFTYENGVKIPYDENGFKYADIDDILMCIEGGSAGKKIGILSEKVCFGNKLCKFGIITEDIIPKYLYYYLQSPVFLKNFYGNLSGIIGGVSINKIKQIEIKYPSVEEQQKIVDKIEELFLIINETAYIDNKLNSLKLDFSNKMKQSILNEVYLGLSSFISENISNWKSNKLNRIADIYTGNSIPETVKKNKYMHIKEGYNYIGTKDLGFNHEFTYENGVKIPYDENGFKYADIDDILMCIEGGSAGKKIGILSEKVCFGNKLCKFGIITEDIIPKYLYYYLQSPVFLKNFYGNLSGIIGGVSINKIKQIEIKYPSVEEQQKIVDKIEELLSICSNIDNLVND